MRLLDALDRYVVQLHADGRSEHTILQYKRHVGLLARWLGPDCALDAITHETLAQFLVSPDARGSRRGGAKRPTSMNALRTSLRTFFSYAHAAGWTRENPARLVRRARCEGPSPRGVSDEDRDKLLGTLIVAQGRVARRDQMLFELLLGTGIRLSAALALTDRDVDLARGELVVRKAKGDRVERVILGRDIRDHLIGYLAERKCGPLFPGSSGRPMTRRQAVRRLQHWMRKAGCAAVVSPHCLRHAFAVRLYRQTSDVLLVQRALGHRCLASTQAYAQADGEMVRAALNAPHH